MNKAQFYAAWSVASPMVPGLDPGTGKPLPIDQSGMVPFAIAASASETNTLAAPIKAGLRLWLVARTVGASGTRAVTVSAAFDGAGNTVLTFSAVGQYAVLESIPASSSTYKWVLTDSTVGIATGGTKYGFIPLLLPSWRLVASNDVPAIAVASGNGGTLASDTAPKLIRVNGATDKALRILWASSSSVEIFNSFAYPPDMDTSVAYTVNLRMGKDTNTDATVTVAVGLFEGVGDTNRGSATAALAAAAVATYSVSITPTAGHPNFAAVTLIPGTHTTDAIYLYEAYINYKRKLLG